MITRRNTRYLNRGRANTCLLPRGLPASNEVDVPRLQLLSYRGNVSGKGQALRLVMEGQKEEKRSKEGVGLGGLVRKAANERTHVCRQVRQTARQWMPGSAATIMSTSLPRNLPTIPEQSGGRTHTPHTTRQQGSAESKSYERTSTAKLKKGWRPKKRYRRGNSQPRPVVADMPAPRSRAAGIALSSLWFYFL